VNVADVSYPLLLWPYGLEVSIQTVLVDLKLLLALIQWPGSANLSEEVVFPHQAQYGLAADYKTGFPK
jgi:hypothetical protein